MGVQLLRHWTWAFFVVLPPKEFNNTVRLVSSASLDYFRSFAFEWLQGWFLMTLNERYLWGQMKLFIVPAHRSLKVFTTDIGLIKAEIG